MTKEYYEKYYKNVEILECIPTSLDRIGFVTREVTDNVEKNIDELYIMLMAYMPKKNPLGIFGTVKITDVGQAYMSSTEKSWIVCNSIFNIDELNNKTDWYPIPNNEQGSLAKGITNIDGEVYAYGMIRSVFKYKGIKEWENITTQSKHPNLYEDVNKSKETFVGGWVGFSALDGFNENDIYAGGNRGDFWHYNGKSWKKIDLPINSDISTITCGKDGKVYVGSRIGNVVIGRENNWEVLKDKAYEMTHSCWFDGKTYFSSEDGRIYTYDEKKKALKEAKFKTSYPEYMHHLIRGIASCDECLVAYTSVQAYAYDGEVWHEIIEIPRYSKHK